MDVLLADFVRKGIIMRKVAFLFFLTISICLSACSSEKSYTLSFDSNGGNAIEPVTTDGKSVVVIPEDPEKSGFVFQGWYLDNDTFLEPFTANSLVNQPITKNLTVFAKWTAVPTDYYTVDFETQCNIGVTSQQVYKETGLSVPDITRNGYTLEGWYTSQNDGLTLDEKWSFETNLVNSNFSLYAKWNVNQYTITFNSKGGTVTPSITQDFGTVLNVPNPTKTDYVFGGWYLDEDWLQPYSLSTMGYENITVFAKWLRTITFISSGENSIPSMNFVPGTSITPPNDIWELGHTFSGWYSDQDFTQPLEFSALPDQNITVFVKWEINQYQLSYESNGGTEYEIQTLDFGSTLPFPTPIKAHYTFGGWYWDEEFEIPWIFPIMPDFNLKLYAKWTPTLYGIHYSEVYQQIGRRTLRESETVVSLSIGEEFSGILTSTGETFMVGENSRGQLGIGSTTDQTFPVIAYDPFKLTPDEKVICLSAGTAHSSALTSNGRLLIWGANSNGQLGNGTTVDVHSPTDITSRFNLSADETIISVTLAFNHSSALTSKGRVFFWGWNNEGQLGDGTRLDKSTPTDITNQFNLSAGETVIGLSLGYTHSSALTSTGRIFLWGSNAHGELGLGTTTATLIPTENTSRFNLLSGETIIQICLGVEFSIALTSTGRIFSWGENSYGQLGNHSLNTVLFPTEITNYFYLPEGEIIIHISSGGYHSSAITSNGQIFSWGNDAYAQLGNGEEGGIKFTPVRITSNFTLINGETILKTILSHNSSSALTSNGRIFMWGDNASGYWADGTMENKSIPTETLVETKISYIDAQAYTFASKIEFPDTDRPGYSFVGWYTDIALTKLFTQIYMPEAQVTLYGKWVLNP